MEKRELEELLKALPGRLIEQARPGLAQEIKNRIPHRLSLHRMDTINIIVDLRISRMAAAAAILVAVFLIGAFFGGRDAGGLQVVQDGKLFVKYALGGEKAYKAEVLGELAKFRDALAAQGREVVFCGDRANLKDQYAILMYWPLPDGKYGVILGDLSARTVTSKTLIRLQARMLQEKTK
jgi:hypothetical protein